MMSQFHAYLLSSVCGGRQLSVSGGQWSVSDSTSGASSSSGGEELVYMPGYEKVKQLKQSVWRAIVVQF